MPKKVQPKRRPAKRGPKEERLVITDDPKAALAKPVRPVKPPKR